MKKKPTAERNRLDALLLAGEKMANIFFNLKQDEKVFDSHQRRVFSECQQEWDAAAFLAREKSRR